MWYIFNGFVANSHILFIYLVFCMDPKECLISLIYGLKIISMSMKINECHVVILWIALLYKTFNLLNVNCNTKFVTVCCVFVRLFECLSFYCSNKNNGIYFCWCNLCISDLTWMVNDFCEWLRAVTYIH